IHADFILILLTPLYLIWDNVKILLIFQTVVLALGVIPVFLLAKKYLKNTYTAFALVIVYLLSPGLEWKSIYDFHAVVLSIPLMLTAYYFALARRWKWLLFFAFLAMLTKEEIPLSVAMLGI